MPRLGPVGRDDLIRYLREFGVEGPYPGRKHQFTVKGDLTLRLPNPHQSDMGVGLLARILRQVPIQRDEWERL